MQQMAELSREFRTPFGLLQQSINQILMKWLLWI